MVVGQVWYSTFRSSHPVTLGVPACPLPPHLFRSDNGLNIGGGGW